MRLISHLPFLKLFLRCDNLVKVAQKYEIKQYFAEKQDKA
jgi:hypothetical protein